jgi:hypothetical protein
MELSIQLGLPETQEFVEHWKTRREIVFLPDITLQKHGMIGPMIEDLGRGEAVTG